MANAISELRGRLAEISDLHRASSLLHWDQHTKMPPLGAPLRAEHIATLSRITHERFISPRTGELIEAATEELDGLPADSVQQRIVSEARRLYEKDRRVPLELAADRSKAASEGYRIWVRRAGGERLCRLRAGARAQFQAGQGLRRLLRRLRGSI